jgi:hypothetical protein
MTEKLFWLFLLLFFGGIVCICFSFYSLKKRELQIWPGDTYFSFELDSEKTWRAASFWYYLFAFLFVGIACIIVGLYGLFFV